MDDLRLRHLLAEAYCAGFKGRLEDQIDMPDWQYTKMKEKADRFSRLAVSLVSEPAISKNRPSRKEIIDLGNTLKKVDDPIEVRDFSLPSPSIVVTDTGDAWDAQKNPEVEGTYYYSEQDLRDLIADLNKN